MDDRWSRVLGLRSKPVPQWQPHPLPHRTAPQPVSPQPPLSFGSRALLCFPHAGSHGGEGCACAVSGTDALLVSSDAGARCLTTQAAVDSVTGHELLLSARDASAPAPGGGAAGSSSDVGAAVGSATIKLGDVLAPALQRAIADFGNGQAGSAPGLEVTVEHWAEVFGAGGELCGKVQCVLDIRIEPAEAEADASTTPPAPQPSAQPSPPEPSPPEPSPQQAPSQQAQEPPSQLPPGQLERIQEQQQRRQLRRDQQDAGPQEEPVVAQGYMWKKREGKFFMSRYWERWHFTLRGAFLYYSEEVRICRGLAGACLVLASFSPMVLFGGAGKQRLVCRLHPASRHLARGFVAPLAPVRVPSYARRRRPRRAQARPRLH